VGWVHTINLRRFFHSLAAPSTSVGQTTKLFIELRHQRRIQPVSARLAQPQLQQASMSVIGHLVSVESPLNGGDMGRASIVQPSPNHAKSTFSGLAFSPCAKHHLTTRNGHNARSRVVAGLHARTTSIHRPKSMQKIRNFIFV
jgi:hypothetical protein